MTYPEFVAAKLRIKDHDALYPAMLDAKATLKVRQQMAFGSVLWDHAGVSAKVAHESTKVGFWEASRLAVAEKARGGARARFRGQKAVQALHGMEALYPELGKLFKRLNGHYNDLEPIIRELPLMGGWAAFKLCDMAERTCGSKISFEGVTLAQISPHAAHGADAAAAHMGITTEQLMDKLYQLSGLGRWPTLAPPLFDRPLNIQEFETMFCNYSTAKWHDPGFETKVLHKELDGWGPIAARFKKELPQ